MRTIVDGTDTAFPLFYAVFDHIVPATNKWMATLFSTMTNSADGIVEVTRIYRYNWDTNYPVSSKLLEQQLVFITARTAGTSIPTRRVDSGVTNTFSLVTLDTNSTGVTIATNGLIRRLFCKQGDPTVEENSDSNALIYERKNGDSGLIVRGNRGVAIQNLTSPGANPGTCSYVFNFHIDTDKTSF